MKRIKEFFTENGWMLLVSVAVIVFSVVIFIPLCIGIARIMWDIAINNPQALM